MSTDNEQPSQEDQAAAEAKHAEAVRLERLKEVDDLIWLMSTKQGRRVVARLLAQAGVYRSSFVAPDAMRVSFLEGQRNIGLMWLTEITEHCPEQLNQMTQEYQANAKRSRSRSRS